MAKISNFSRRRLIQGISFAAGSSLIYPALAEELILTPRQSEGPFYPLKLPLDADNDLVKIKDRKNNAAGHIAHIAGRVLNLVGEPVAGARVEIWQCDAFGRYHHPGDGDRADPNFQGFGKTVTDRRGAYRFRTIKPVRYTGRAPHIHFAVVGKKFGKLITQMYLAGAPQNKSDFLLNNIHSKKGRESLMVALRPADNVEKGALAGKFDIVVDI